MVLLNNTSLEASWDYLNNWIRERGLSLVEVYETVLTPLLHRVGTAWQRGDLSIGDEHIISGKIRQLIVLVSHSFTGNKKAVDPIKRWIGCCPPGEEHDMGLLMLSSVMARNGWDVKNLGMNIPFQDLLSLVEEFKPQVVAFSCVNPGSVNGLESYAESLKEKGSFPFQIQAGGAGLYRRRATSEAVLYSATLTESLIAAENFFKEVL